MKSIQTFLTLLVVLALSDAAFFVKYKDNHGGHNNIKPNNGAKLIIYCQY